MSPDQKKRVRSGEGNEGKVKKRQKTGKKSAPKSVPKTKRAVVLNELPWQEVDMPEMFEDAEGFYGLEEVDDVEIIRDGSTVQFLSTRASSPLASDGDKEFEGFADDDAILDDPTRHLVAAETIISREAGKDSAKPKKKKKEDKKTKDAEIKPTDKPKEELETKAENAFAVLADHAAEEEVDVSAWKELKLSSLMLSALAKIGFAIPTPIQIGAIPSILEGHDVIGKASTGSGKTLAFVIPIVEKWLEQNSNRTKDDSTTNPIAVILSPTRELAHQLAKHIKALCSGLADGPFIAAVTGGLSIQKQQRQLKRADIVVGTPGRLWEVMSASNELSESMRASSFLVIDEADRMLTEGHFKEAEEIISSLDRQTVSEEEDDEDEARSMRQTLVFSATLSKGLQQKLAGKGRPGYSGEEQQSMEYLLNKLNFREEKPQFIDVNPNSQMAEGLKEGLLECSALEKDLYLYALLMFHPGRRTLVFTNSIHSVRRLVPMLQNLGLPAHALHSQMAQKARMRSIERFTASSSSSSSSTTITTSKSPSSSSSPAGASPAILVATDVAARGLDVAGVRLVLHYHLPRTAAMYVHRSGRTARAGAAGLSVLLCAPEELVATRRLVAKVHARATLRGAAAADDAVRGSSTSDKKNTRKMKNKKRTIDGSGPSEEEDEEDAEKGTAAAAAAAAGANKAMRSLALDRKLVARLRPRVALAKTLADAALAREKGNHEAGWLHAAAADLGVEYDSDDFSGEGGRGSGRRRRERAARALPGPRLAAMRAELRRLLAQRVNVGVSESYLTAGRVDVNALLSAGSHSGGAAGGEMGGGFLGEVDDIGFAD